MADLKIQNLSIHGAKPSAFAARSGERLFLSGPSGAGKSLLLRAIVDLDQHEGAVFLGETESKSIPAASWRSMIGYLPTKVVWWKETVGEHMLSAPKDEDLYLLGFDRDTLTWPISRLSAGEARRLSLLRLLSQKPKALLLDEPTANLDTESTQRVERLILHYQKTTGAPIIWVSHSDEQKRRLADRILYVIDKCVQVAP